MGRPTKLTPTAQKRIVEAIEDGLPVTHACRGAGISPTSFYDWLDRGARGEKPFARFAEAVEEAKARSVACLVAKIRASDDWRAAAWLLTRRAPESFVDPVRRGDLAAAEARARVTVAEARDRLEYLEARRRIRLEDSDGSIE